MVRPSFFSSAWMDDLVVAWNEYPQHHGKLAGAGAVVLEVLDPEKRRSFVLFWDDEGRLSRLETRAEDEFPRFSAAASEWHEFVNGEYSAVAGVMAGRIQYEGRMSFAFRYGSHFDTLATVARNL